MHIIESPVVMREEEERKLCRHGLGLLWAGDGLYPVLAVGVVLLVVLLLARHLGAKLILLEIIWAKATYYIILPIIIIHASPFQIYPVVPLLLSM